jgi:cytoskeletal protein RodZ
MASTYYATSRIQHGVGNGEEKVFVAGDKVEGLTKEEMVALWNAGVLSERDPNQSPPDERDDKIAELEKQLADLKAQAVAPVEPEGESPDDDDKSKTVATSADAQATQPVTPAKKAATPAVKPE